MSTAPPIDEAAACLARLEAALPGGPPPDLAGLGEKAFDAAVRELVTRHGAGAVALLQRLAAEAPTKPLRRVARRALYRLAQSGVAAPSPAPAAPVVKRERERAVKAWVSGIDGSGSRAVWIVFEGGLGAGLRLCSLILNDEVGVLEAAGGPITRKRLETELGRLREDQKLPWVEMAPGRACALVMRALALHERAHTRPPAEFSLWQPVFAPLPPEPATADLGALESEPALLEASPTLLELPELAGWFVDPALIQEESLARLEMQDSRLIVSDQIKGEREAAIVDRAVAKGFSPEARRRWAARLVEMAWIFDATGRPEPARMARAAAAAFSDEGRPVESIPLARAMAFRGLELAGEVALGRVRLEEVSRAPAIRPRSGSVP